MNLTSVSAARADVGEVWEHRRCGLTAEVHLVLSYYTDWVGTRVYQLLDLQGGTIHPKVLIGLSGEDDFGWRRVT